jgi:hypothetical protein
MALTLLAPWGKNRISIIDRKKEIKLLELNM